MSEQPKDTRPLEVQTIDNQCQLIMDELKEITHLNDNTVPHSDSKITGAVDSIEVCVDNIRVAANDLASQIDTLRDAADDNDMGVGTDEEEDFEEPDGLDAADDGRVQSRGEIGFRSTYQTQHGEIRWGIEDENPVYEELMDAFADAFNKGRFRHLIEYLEAYKSDLEK